MCVALALSLSAEGKDETVSKREEGRKEGNFAANVYHSLPLSSRLRREEEDSATRRGAFEANYSSGEASFRKRRETEKGKNKSG